MDGGGNGSGPQSPPLLLREPNTSLKLPLAIPSDYGYDVVDVAPGLTFQSPIGLVTRPGETNQLFVMERAGRIFRIADLAHPVAEVFLDIRSKVSTLGEGGLLGCAFHPRFAENGLFYVHYTSNTNPPNLPVAFHDRLARFSTVPGNPDLADPASEHLLIDQPDETLIHNAGDVHFGPDGYLYTSFGSGVRSSESITMDDVYIGSMIRIDVDRREGNLPPNRFVNPTGDYLVPADNPFIGITSYFGRPLDTERLRTEVWALGFRNPFRFAFDPADGRLFVGDVGQIRREEINLVVRGGFYGWPVFEGTLPYDVNVPVPPDQELIPPIHEYGGSGLRACVIGGIVYRGQDLPELSGYYLFADWSRTSLSAVSVNAEGAVDVKPIFSNGFRPQGFGPHPGSGEVLFADSATGRIFQIIRAEASKRNSLPATLSTTGAFRSLETLEPEPGVVPYVVNVPFWSDAAIKKRWFCVPDPANRMDWQETAPWRFPDGTVWVKHFDMEATEGDPQTRYPLETRFLVKATNGFYGVTYRWREGGQDADLVSADGQDVELRVPSGSTDPAQRWRFPSRGECMLCHYPSPRFVLGFNSEQLNGEINYEGVLVNQLQLFEEAGYLERPLPPAPELPRLFAGDDPVVTKEVHARSFLASNCAYCHQWFTGGLGRGLWDLRFERTLASTLVVNQFLADPIDDPSARVLFPGQPNHSMMFRRMRDLGAYHMPPIGSYKVTEEGVRVLGDWIANTAFVTGRAVFYNNSAFDGFTPDITAADTNAIAIDKTALLPGEIATFANYTSFIRGINGIMVDVAGLGDGLTLDDFVLEVGNRPDRDGWSVAAAPDGFRVERGAGAFQSDRITLAWSGDGPRNTWLRVRLKASPRTRLGATDEFYFGNAVGDVGDQRFDTVVGPVDEEQTIRNATAPGGAAITSPFDFNRDRQVDDTDVDIVRNAQASGAEVLRIIQPVNDAWKAGRLLEDALVALDNPVVVPSEPGVVRIEGPGAQTLRFSGVPAKRYVVEGSDGVDLPWTAVLSAPVTCPPEGELLVRVPLAADTGARFFRIREVR